MREFDVVIVGAGIAGSAAARAFAQRGARVALVDARPLADAGARWVNGVPPWMFDAADVPRPTAPERRPSGAFVMLDAAGRRHVTVDPSPVAAVDMRLLGARLRGDAEAAGAALLGEHRVRDLELDPDGRPRALTVEGPTGRRTLHAPLFVDAAGLKGVLRRRVPRLEAACPPLERVDICSAAQAVLHLTDRDAAGRWLDARGARPLETLSRAGVSGGYSISNVMVDLDNDEVELLTGAVAEPRFSSGPQILADQRAELPFAGETVFGGSGALPIRRCSPRLGAPGIALLGDAGCQVFPAHGSGIGIGMVAARLLVEAMLEDPGSARATWTYTQQFQREWGGLLAAFDLFRRLSQELAADQTAALLSSGLITTSGAFSTLDQRLPAPAPGELPGMIRGFARTPRLAARMARVLAWIPIVVRAHRRFPDHPKGLPRWADRLDRTFIRATGRR